MYHCAYGGFIVKQMQPDAIDVDFVHNFRIGNRWFPQSAKLSQAIAAAQSQPDAKSKIRGTEGLGFAGVGIVPCGCPCLPRRARAPAEQ